MAATMTFVQQQRPLLVFVAGLAGAALLGTSMGRIARTCHDPPRPTTTTTDDGGCGNAIGLWWTAAIIGALLFGFAFSAAALAMYKAVAAGEKKIVIDTN